jgi:hypothetical protein
MCSFNKIIMSHRDFDVIASSTKQTTVVTMKLTPQIQFTPETVSE